MKIMPSKELRWPNSYTHAHVPSWRNSSPVQWKQNSLSVQHPSHQLSHSGCTSSRRPRRRMWSIVWWYEFQPYFATTTSTIVVPCLAAPDSLPGLPAWCAFECGSEMPSSCLSVGLVWWLVMGRARVVFCCCCCSPPSGLHLPRNDFHEIFIHPHPRCCCWCEYEQGHKI